MTQHLSKAEFLQKVFNFEQNKEWQFEGDVPCIVDFYADWCQPCKLLAPVLDELAGEYRGKINVYKVDIGARTGTGRRLRDQEHSDDALRAQQRQSTGDNRGGAQGDHQAGHSRRAGRGATLNRALHCRRRGPDGPSPRWPVTTTTLPSKLVHWLPFPRWDFAGRAASAQRVGRARRRQIFRPETAPAVKPGQLAAGWTRHGAIVDL